MPAKTNSIYSDPVCQLRYFFTGLFLLLNSLSLCAAEEVLLTIGGNLIDRVEILDANPNPDLIISAYYDLLPEETKADIEFFRSRLEQLQPDYKVAFLAADSAEMAEVREDIDEQWTGIQSIHRYFFSIQVVEILNQAYIKNFEGLLPEEPDI